MKNWLHGREKYFARTMSSLLIVVLIVTMTPFVPPSDAAIYAADKPKGNWIQHAAKSFAGGNGSQKKPYIIKTAAQLAYLAKRVDASHAKDGNYTKFRYYKLANDIDLSKHYWTPIGRSDGNVYKTLLYGKAFRGIFDGGGYTIRGLKIKGDEEYAGLFGVCGDILYRDEPEARKEFGSYEGFEPMVGTDDILKNEKLSAYTGHGTTYRPVTEIKTSTDLPEHLPVTLSGRIFIAVRCRGAYLAVKELAELPRKDLHSMQESWMLEEKCSQKALPGDSLVH